MVVGIRWIHALSSQRNDLLGEHRECPKLPELAQAGRIRRLGYLRDMGGTGVQGSLEGRGIVPGLMGYIVSAPERLTR